MKKILLLCIIALISLSACTDSKRQQVLAEQEQIIREEYPCRMQNVYWENYIKYSYIAANHFADVLPPMAKPFFELLWMDAKSKGYYQDVFEKVKASKDTTYAKPYIDFMAFYYSDYYEEDQPSDVELMYHDFQNVGKYDICPKAEEILEYAMGRVKYHTEKPVITAVEHVDDDKYGEGGYWIVHLQEGTSRNLRFYTTDEGKMNFERVE